LHIPRVIAGIDLSVIGRRVAERGRIVAETSGASLELVHVLDPLADAMIPQSLVKLVDEHREQAAHNTLSWVKGRTDVPVDLHVIKGSPAWEMVRLAKQGDLAIVGNSNLDTARIGPVAAAVARMASSDVLIVRRQPRAPYRRAIAAVDFSEASKAAVQQVLERFPDAEVTALFSLPTRFDPLLSQAGLFEEEVAASRSQRLEESGLRMEEFIENWPGRVRPLVVDGPPEETVAEMVRRRGADLVSVASRGAGATRMVLLGSVAEAVAAAVPCDVLVARVPSTFRRP